MAAEVASVPSSGPLHRDETAPQMRGHAGNQIVELDANAANYVQGNDRTHDTDFQEEMKLAHYRPTPLPVPFTPLSARGRRERGPLILPEPFLTPHPPTSPATSTMGGTAIHGGEGGRLVSRGSLTSRPGGTRLPTRHSETIELFRVALPLDTTPRGTTPRSTRVLRDSAYGKTAWDRTDSTHLRASTPEVRGTPSKTHRENLRPWLDPAGKPGAWAKWQSDPAARNQSPRSQRRVMAAIAAAHPDGEEPPSQPTAPLEGRSEATKEWWASHQTNIHPYRTNFAAAKLPKRSTTEIWPAAGRGVLHGWYTPRVSTPERMAQERERQDKLLRECMDHSHDADAAQNADDAEAAVASLSEVRCPTRSTASLFFPCQTIVVS